jgi:SulP family sulfate permease
MVTGIALGAFDNATFRFGPTSVQVYKPSLNNFINAVVLLVIPQIPLTIGNAVIGTKDTCRTLFGSSDITKRVTYHALGTSMGLVNIITGFIAGIPLCHGAGGLAAHHRFGARTGGANIMIGLVFLILALGFGRAGIVLLSSIPNAVLGVFLLFAGLELALLIKDVREKEELFISFLIAGVGFATANMGFAFFVGIMVLYFIKGRNLKL